METKKILVITKEVSTKDGTKKFFAHKAKQKDGTLVNCRFRMDCNTVPTIGRHWVEVTTEGANMSYTGEFPCLWVNHVESIEEVEQKVNNLDNF